MDRFCGSKFWDLNVTWYTNDPDLTPCFQKTVLVWIPLAFQIFIPLPLCIKRATVPTTIKKDGRPLVHTIAGKTMVTSILIAIQMATLAFPGLQFIDSVASGLKVLTYVIQCITSLLMAKKDVELSRINSTFWILTSICDLLPFRSLVKLLIGRNDITNVTEIQILHFVHYFFVLVQTFFHCLTCSKSDNEDEPERNSSPFGQVLYQWFDSVVWKGYRQPLKLNDLGHLEPSMRSSTSATSFQKHWRYGKEENGGVLHVLVKLWGLDVILCSFISSVFLIIDAVSALSVGLIVNFVTGSEEMWKGYVYCFILFFFPLVFNLGDEFRAHLHSKTSVRIKGGLMCAIYRKSLVLSPAAKSQFSSGQLANLMSLDVQKVAEADQYIDKIWSCLLRIVVSTWLLWFYIGPSALAGTAVVLVLLPASYYLAKFDKLHLKKQMKFKDERLTLVASIFSGIKTLKFYAWEEIFRDRVCQARKKEKKAMEKSVFLQGGVSFFWTGSQVWIVLSVLLTYSIVSRGTMLDASTVFVTLSVVKQLCQALSKLPRSIVGVFQASVSLKRIDKFLKSEQLSTIHTENLTDNAKAIEIEDLNVSWAKNVRALNNVNLIIPKGSLVAIVGAVGSGKSALLAALAQEVQESTGRIGIKGSTIYLKQQPWIKNTTVQDNILFGRSHDSVKYEKVIRACALKSDFQMLPAADFTEIGEKGVNLSGGQNQRVALARVVYHDADIYLLDDPLSAVDVKVGKEIFRQVIGAQGLLKEKTRILVTHGLQFVCQADIIILVENGHVPFIGSYEDLCSSAVSQLKNFVLQQSCISTNEADGPCDSNAGRSENENGALIATEKSKHGGVGRSAYWVYVKAVGLKYALPILLTLPLYEVLSLVGNTSLKSLSDDNYVNGTASHRNVYLGVYAALSVPQFLTFTASAMAIAVATLKASSHLHFQTLDRLLRAPLSFFDTTPAGRVLNRFAEDIDVLDNGIALNVRSFLFAIWSLVTTVGVILYTLPAFIFACFPFGFMYYGVQKLYMPCSRELKRLESNSKSPVFSFFDETLNGSVTIRAHRQQERFFNEFSQKLDSQLNCYYLRKVSNRWLYVRLAVLAGLIKLTAALLAVHYKDSLSPGLVGLVISYTLSLSDVCSRVVREWSDIDAMFVAVERLLEYTKLPQEAQWVLSSNSLPSFWPEKGEVRFVNYSTRYRPGLDLVLKDLNLTIKAGEKVGVVGRTGAGKSSLSLALFRILEAANGQIIMDGVDIATLGLHSIRSKLTIIPQNPILFYGTLRFNVDPLDEHTDEEIWRALEMAHLKLYVTLTPQQLDFTISEEGTNLSVGQKQLVCLARAILRGSKILILDEATASVDMETDELIQQTIRKEFKDCTVITIAHRLHTVMDYDRIIVMDAGCVVECDTPENLLSNCITRFSHMAESAGIICDDYDYITRL